MSPAPCNLRVASLAALALWLTSCANPTAAYHRQFEYLLRVGGEAVAAGRLDEARDHLDQAADLVPFAKADDLEFVDVLTRLGEVSRRIGRIDDARGRMKTAGRVLARYRAREGDAGWSFPRIAGAYALESARLASFLGDLPAAEAFVREFLVLRGSRASAADAAEAHWLLGELLVARDLPGHARYEFTSALAYARALEGDALPLRSAILLRAAETAVGTGQLSAAADLVEATRPGGLGRLEERPSLLLVLARIDVAQGNVERARLRLGEALDLMSERDALDLAAPSRAAAVASLVFDATRVAELSAALDRSAALAERTAPLGRVLLGRALIAAGRETIAAGQRTPGLRALERGRDVIERALGDRPHVSRVDANFEIAEALDAIGHLDTASRYCGRVLDGIAALAEVTTPEVDQTGRIVACGRIAARASRVPQARTAFMRALAVSQASDDSGLQLELLIRLAALAYLEERDSAEKKLFERALPFLHGDPGMERVPALLREAYGSHGSTQPSSAAARLAHTAVRMTDHHVAASRLQAIATVLSDQAAPPASRR